MGGKVVFHLYLHPVHRWVVDSLQTWKQKQQTRESRNIDELYRADPQPGLE